MTGHFFLKINRGLKEEVFQIINHLIDFFFFREYPLIKYITILQEITLK